MGTATSHAKTDTRSASCPQDVWVGRGRHARDPRGSAGPYATMAAALAAYDQHLGLANAHWS